MYRDVHVYSVHKDACFTIVYSVTIWGYWKLFNFDLICLLNFLQSIMAKENGKHNINAFDRTKYYQNFTLCTTKDYLIEEWWFWFYAYDAIAKSNIVCIQLVK